MARTFDAPSASDNWLYPTRLTVHSKLRFPFRTDLTAILFVEDYAQRPDNFTPLALDSIHPDLEKNITTEAGLGLTTENENQLITQPGPAYLVEESNPQMTAEGMFRWTRTYATVPATRVEFEKGSFNFPAYKTNTAATTLIRESFTQSVVSKVTYSYILTTDPGSDLTITNRFQPLDSGDEKVNFLGSDSTPTLAAYETKVTNGTYIQSRETEVSRWMGNIWQMKNVEVVAL